MNLRKLTPTDAPYMLEWMHDPDVVGHLSTNFAEKSLDDCLRFIAYAENTRDDLHLAIVDDTDTYMGTVSLKHIHNGTAEFAITVRKCAMGKGYSHFGMQSVLEIGKRELGLTGIYWCVSIYNQRAVRFYDKNGYTRTENIPQSIMEAYSQELLPDLIWYIY